jgi:hypothetical protein
VVHEDRPLQGQTESTEDIHIWTFLIADMRGWTRFTQEHGDEAAAKLAANSPTSRARGSRRAVIPWWLTGWRVQLRWAPPVRFLGLVLIVAGIAVLVQALGRFVFEGRGTPSPVESTMRYSP